MVRVEFFDRKNKVVVGETNTPSPPEIGSFIILKVGDERKRYQVAVLTYDYSRSPTVLVYYVVPKRLLKEEE